MNRNRILRSTARGQRGVTMLVALIMLVMLTLLAVSSFRVSNSNLKVVAGMQGQGEATAAAQTAIDQLVSSGAFALDPARSTSRPRRCASRACGKSPRPPRMR